MPHFHARARRSRRRLPAHIRVSLGALVGLGLLLPATLSAADAVRRTFDIPVGDAQTALKLFAVQAGEQLLYSSDDVGGVQTHAVQGEFIPLVALEHMLKSTSLKARQDEKTKAIAITANLPARAPVPPKSPLPASPSEPPNAGPPPPMKKSLPTRLFAALAAFTGATLPAQTDPATGAPLTSINRTAASGVIEGRVFSPATGSYVTNAQVTVVGTTLETFTNDSGFYRLTGVMEGEAKVKVFYTGMRPRIDSVRVNAGQTAQHDVSVVGGNQRTTSNGDVVKLDKFVVETSMEMDGAALAINEQRFAPNIKNVLSSDEFGAIAEGNAGEFLKYLPGIAIDSVGGDARAASINGVPSGNVPVTVGGFSLASAPTGGSNGRVVEFEQISLNNVSRIEISQSPTPESSGSALAGSINFVPRSAFERSKPTIKGSVYLMMRDNERDFHKTPGPRKDPTRKVLPGLEFSAIVPVNKRFGFTISGSNSTLNTTQNIATLTWRGASSATNPANFFPDTTPDKPYLTNYTVWDGTKFSRRSSASITLDYKLGPNDTLSFSAQYSFFNQEYNNRQLQFVINRVSPGDFSPTFTHSQVGQGEIRLQNLASDKVGNTYMPTLTYRHEGPVWKSEAGLGLSHATNDNTDISKGYFYTTLARRTGVTVSFDDIFYLRPRVTVQEGATGATVNPNSIDSYSLATAGSMLIQSADAQRTAFANLRRDFDVRGFPITLKGGLDVRQSLRDIRGATPNYNFNGADGRASTTPTDTRGTDDGAGMVFDDGFASSDRTAPFGFGKVQWVSNEKYWDLYKAHPEYFSTTEATNYRTSINQSKVSEETISSAYIRTDLQFFDRRLKVVAGVRAEQTNVAAQGPLTDVTRSYVRDAAGKVVLDASGRPAVSTTDPLAIAKLTAIDRGLHVKKEYLRLFPSITASYNVRENLIARASYYQSVGRPNFDQYSGALTLPDTEIVPGPTNRIQVNNASIKAWSAETVKVRLEYYFQGVGQVSIGGFRRDFENFFGSTTFASTPQFLALYDLDPNVYGAYNVTTQYNLPDPVRMEGLEFDYKQALTFLPHVARGLQVFANASSLRATGNNSSNFAGYVPRTANWGISLTRPKYNLRLNWAYRGRARSSLVAAGNSIEPGTYNWIQKRRFLDVQGEYYFMKRFAVFADLRNVTDDTNDTEVSGPSTPPHAQLRQREDFSALWTFGIKGSF